METTTQQPLEPNRRRASTPATEPDKKDNGIIRAEVIAETSGDWTRIENGDPNYVYKWGRKSDQIEMNMFAQKGYEPARGNERIFGNPFDDGTQDCGPGKLKVRGDRILMKCLKKLVDARLAKQAQRSVDAKTGAERDAARMRTSHRGITIKPEGEQYTRRESIAEAQ